MGDDPRVSIRDELLNAIVAHVRRRGDDHLADLAERAIGLVRANNDRLRESNVIADVRGFAQMDLARGKAKPSSALRAAKLKHGTAATILRMFLEQTPRATREQRCAVIAEIWRAWHDEDGPQLSAQELKWVGAGRDADGMALRLVFRFTRAARMRQERFDDFRRQMNRTNVRPHPWLARDTKS